MPERGLAELYSGLLLPAANAFKDITLRGVHVDQTRLGAVIEDWAPKLFNMEANLQRIAYESGWPTPDINLGSHLQRAAFVYDTLQCPVTRAGRTTDKKVMAQFHEQGLHPFFDSWANWSHMDHLLRSYIKPLPYLVRPETSCLHPEVRLHNTVTGRLAYANPPLQQIPKYVELSDVEDALMDQFITDEFGTPFTGFGGEATELRRMFDARPGYVIAEFDYERIELYTGAYVSGDETLLAALRSGDFHGNTARFIFGFSDQEWAELPDKGANSRDYWRRESKYVTFGILNDRGATALARGELKNLTGGSTLKAQKFIDDWHNLYWKYAEYKEWICAEAERFGELISLAGRHRRFPLVPLDHHQRKQAINFPVQSLASDVCLSSLIELHTTLRRLGGFILFSIHDCILFELPSVPERLNECLCLIEDTMTKPRFPELMSIPVEGKVGTNWGDSKVYTRQPNDTWALKGKAAA